MDELTLGADFPAVTEQEWRDLVDRVLTRGGGARRRGSRGSSDSSRRPRTGCASSRSTRRRSPPRRRIRACPGSRRTRGDRRRSATARAAGTSASVSWPVTMPTATAMQVRDELERGATSIVLDVAHQPVDGRRARRRSPRAADARARRRAGIGRRPPTRWPRCGRAAASRPTQRRPCSAPIRSVSGPPVGEGSTSPR